MKHVSYFPPFFQLNQILFSLCVKLCSLFIGFAYLSYFFHWPMTWLVLCNIDVTPVNNASLWSDMVLHLLWQRCDNVLSEWVNPDGGFSGALLTAGKIVDTECSGHMTFVILRALMSSEFHSRVVGGHYSIRNRVFFFVNKNAKTRQSQIQTGCLLSKQTYHKQTTITQGWQKC